MRSLPCSHCTVRLQERIQHTFQHGPGAYATLRRINGICLSNIIEANPRQIDMTDYRINPGTRRTMKDILSQVALCVFFGFAAFGGFCAPFFDILHMKVTISLHTLRDANRIR